MARIFISHASANNAEALALRDWLVARGWDDLFLDIDPQRGLVSGQRWLEKLQESAQRCKAVLFLVSRAWLASRYCTAEFWEARKQERPLFALVIDDTKVEKIPAEMRGVWQLAFLNRGSAFETFTVKPPPAYAPTGIRFSTEGLESLRRGLAEAGLTSFDTESFPWPSPGFEFETDGTTPRRPYRGLKPIDDPDAGLFFGRDADLVRARDRLAKLQENGGRCLVVILGASGAGKSSFLRAGLIPRLARDDRRFFTLPVLRPREAAMWGDEGLLSVLEKASRKAELTVSRAELRQDLESGGAPFLLRLAEIRSAATAGLEPNAKPPTLVLSIDQAEELFTSVRSDRCGEGGDPESALFLARLGELLRHGPEAIALLTIRSDAYEPLQGSGGLAGLLQDPFNLPPLSVGDYRTVIEGPVRRAADAGRSLTFQPSLAAALLADAQGVDALPLLGFTLERLYVEHGGDGELNLSDYEALGGVQGSIEAAVAEAFAHPSAPPQIHAEAAQREALLKRAFVPHLMGANEANGEPVRRTARRADLPAETFALIDRLVQRRLLVIDRRQVEGREEETVIEVAHEALLRQWPTLCRWHDQEREALKVQQEVARAAAAWDQNGRETDWLGHRGARLADAKMLAQREDFAKAFDGMPRKYLDACHKAEEDTRDAEAQRLARQRKLQNRVGILLSVIALATTIGGGMVVATKRDLGRQESQQLASSAKEALDAGHLDSALRIALLANQDTWLKPTSLNADTELRKAAYSSGQISRLRVFGSDIEEATFLDNNSRILTSSGDGLRVWTQHNGGALTSQHISNTQFFSIQSSADSATSRFIAIDAHRTIWVWSRASDRSWNYSRIATLATHWDTARLSLDGSLVLTTSSIGTITAWQHTEKNVWLKADLVRGHGSIADSIPLWTPRRGLFKYPTQVLAFNASCVLLKASDSRLSLWAPLKNKTWTSIPLLIDAHNIHSASLNDDCSSTLLVNGTNVPILFEKLPNGRWERRRSQPDTLGPILAATSSGKSFLLLFLDKAGILHVSKRNPDGSWVDSRVIGDQPGVLSAKFSSYGDSVLVKLPSREERLYIRFDSSFWKCLSISNPKLGDSMGSISHDGTRALTVVRDGSAMIWGVRTKDVYVLPNYNNIFRSAIFSPNGKYIISLDKFAIIWHRTERRAWPRRVLGSHLGPLLSGAFARDGTRIITTFTDGTIQLWTLGPTGTWLKSFERREPQPLEHVLFSPSGNEFLTVSELGFVARWLRGKSGTWFADTIPVARPLMFTTAVAYFPDGSHIVTASWDGIDIWSQSVNGKWESYSLKGHRLPVTSLAVSFDGSHIVTISQDRTVRIWQKSKDDSWTSVDVDSHENPVTSVRFSPDGQRFVTASMGGSIRLWLQGERESWSSVVLGRLSEPAFGAEYSPKGDTVLAGSYSSPHIWEIRWLMGPGDWARNEKHSLPEAVCREKLHGSWTTVKEPKTGNPVLKIAERLLTADDIQSAPILAGREGEDVCEPFLHQPWWSRLAFWR